MKLPFITAFFIHFLLFVPSTDARRIKATGKRNLQITTSPGKGKGKGSGCNTGKGKGESSSTSPPGKGKGNGKGSSTSSPRKGKGKGSTSVPCDPVVPPPTTAPTTAPTAPPTISNDSGFYDRNLKGYKDDTHSNKHRGFRGSA